MTFLQRLRRFRNTGRFFRQQIQEIQAILIEASKTGKRVLICKENRLGFTQYEQVNPIAGGISAFRMKPSHMLEETTTIAVGTVFAAKLLN